MLEFRLQPENVQDLGIPLLSHPFFNTDTPKIVLMGDSVLDNFIWLDNPADNLRAHLQQACDDAKSGSPYEHIAGYQVVDLAMDETSTYDFLVRTSDEHPWGTYADARRRVFKTPHHDYPVAEDGNYYPVEVLRRLRNVHYVILSLGGNDVYLNANNQRDLALSTIPFMGGRSTAVAKGMSDRLRHIVAAIACAAPAAVVVPVVVYHPHDGFSISGLGTAPGIGPTIARSLQAAFLAGAVTPLARVAIEYAARLQLPVIDLSSTLKRNVASHYGTGPSMKPNRFVEWSGAEPSNAAVDFIARLIAAAAAAAPYPHPYTAALAAAPRRGGGARPIDAPVAATAAAIHGALTLHLAAAPLPAPLPTAADVAAYFAKAAADASSATDATADALGLDLYTRRFVDAAGPAPAASGGAAAPADASRTGSAQSDADGAARCVVLRGAVNGDTYEGTVSELNDDAFRRRYEFGRHSR